MSIQLYSHNQTAYESAVSMLTEQGKAAIVHPTGTGKSFIGFKLCEDNPDKTICWLSPSRYIYNTQIENLKEVSNGYEPENVNFYTYAKLMNMIDDELAEIKPDYIILDEFHRCGAELWGAGVQKLLNMYPSAYVLGLSATAIRYLDNQRNMTEELFDGNIASEMTLGEAIVHGILQPPKYVLSILSYQKDLEEYEKRVRNMKIARFRDTATEYLEALRRALDKADKLDVLFEKHMTERNGKYIVFCANRDHMRDMIDLADEWFAKVDKDFHIYKAYSSDPETSKAFADFKADTSNHLKLLYCIDMLNEGVHVDDISGVILLRPTLSPIIYKQQIGRALSASGKRTPVIFDIVNNVENLYSIDAVREEMEIAVQYFHEYARDGEIVNETFEVNDDIRDCIKLFEALEESLTFTWDVMYAEAKRYYEQNGDLRCKRTYVNEAGYNLGNWIMTQKIKYRNNNLEQEKIEKLEKIGIIWTYDDLWNIQFESAKKFYEENGNLDIPYDYVTEDGFKLGNWYRMVRKAYLENRYSEERNILLESIGMERISYSDRIWMQKYEMARAFYEEHGDLNIPRDYMSEDGSNIGNWVSLQRTDYNKGLMSGDRIQLLEQIGISWNRDEDRWNEGFENVKKYIEAGNDIKSVPHGFIFEGFKLSKWLEHQRKRYRIGIMSAEEITKLESLGIVWDKKNDLWQKNFNAAKQYFAEYGDLLVPTKLTTQDGIKLGSWITRLRMNYRKGLLTEEQTQQLEEIGMIWDYEAYRNQTELAHATQFYEENGHLNIPSDYVCEDGYRLGAWLPIIRARYKDGTIEESYIKQLESVGMVWNAKEKAFYDNLHSLELYYKENGNFDVPTAYKTQNGFSLGQWVYRIKKEYESGKMSEERINKMKAVGFEF